MADVTIPAQAALNIAWELRARAKNGGQTMSRDDLRMHADLLDPPAPSLRDEVARLVDIGAGMNFSRLSTADEILAVVRRHIEGLDRHGFVPGKPHMWASHPKGVWLDRDDVLRLLGDNA